MRGEGLFETARRPWQGASLQSAGLYLVCWWWCVYQLACVYGSLWCVGPQCVVVCVVRAYLRPVMLVGWQCSIDCVVQWVLLQCHQVHHLRKAHPAAPTCQGIQGSNSVCRVLSCFFGGTDDTVAAVLPCQWAIGHVLPGTPWLL